MARRLALACAAAAAAGIALLAAPLPALAQNPPTERELNIYAGLHAAAATGDVAEIERLVKDGEKLELGCDKQPHAADRRPSASNTPRRPRS